MSTPAPGLGAPDRLAQALAPATRLSHETVVWPGGLVLDLAAYGRPVPAVPDTLVTSVRCLVFVERRLVVCSCADGEFVWPGGRREPGESHEQTARREVHEETGWQLDDGPLQPVGLLHYRHVSPVPADHPYPHPDFCQVVYAGAAHRHAGRPEAWCDLDGYVSSSWLAGADALTDLDLTQAERILIDAAATAGYRLGQ